MGGGRCCDRCGKATLYRRLAQCQAAQWCHVNHARNRRFGPLWSARRAGSGKFGPDHGGPRRSSFPQRAGRPGDRYRRARFMCVGAKPPFDHPHVFLDMGGDAEIICPYCSTLYRHDPSLDPHAARPAECAAIETSRPESQIGSPVSRRRAPSSSAAAESAASPRRWHWRSAAFAC